ncbi:MAG: helix-turn-helix domain-containing protein [Myxococcaceae bacterium]
MKSRSRPYRMTRRAEAAEATGQRILDAARALFVELPFDELTLEQVARRAGVTLQTVLRRFGSKAGLITALGQTVGAEVDAQRFQVTPGELGAIVENLFDHYETTGRTALKLLAQEERFDEIAAFTRQGRGVHERWVRHAFGPWLARRRGAARRRLELQLIAVCDVSTWKVLRLDRRVSRREAEQVVRGVLEPLCR